MRQTRTDEEIVSSVNELLAKNPRANRKEIFKVCKVGLPRFNDLVERNLIKLPPPQKLGQHWRNFKVGGSK